MGIAGDIILIVIAGTLAGIVAQRLRQPMIVGYILAGVLIGPNTGGVTVSDVHNIELLAEVGVALLLFALGLEISFKELKAVRNVAAFGTPIQILLTIGFGHLSGLALGWSSSRGIWFGGLIALSSTMVVLKTIAARGLMGTMSSRVMVGMLIAQDLAVVPLVILLPQLGSDNPDLIGVSYALLRAAGVLLSIYLAGTRVVPIIMRFIARQNSRELFMLTTIGLAFGIGWLTHMAGLSFAFGAFVAGIVLSESDYGHEALSEILSLRDLFGLVFFTSIGMLLEPDLIVRNWVEVATMVALVLLGKGLIFAGVTRAFGYSNVVPLATGLGLSQIGEFSFLLARLGMDTGSIDRDLFGLTISTAVITMLLTPYLTLLVDPAYKLQQRIFPRPVPTTAHPETPSMAGHAVIVGGGRVGHQVASVLHAYSAPFLLIDYDQRRVDQAKDNQLPVMFGDATNRTILEAAGVSTAKIAVVTLPVAGVARDVARKIRELNPGVFLIARSETVEEISQLAALGADEVVQPEFEASLEIIRKTLLQLDISPLEVQRFIEATHQNMYRQLAEDSTPARSHQARPARYLDLRWLEVATGSGLDGHSIGSLGLRKELGVSVIAIVRGAQTTYNVGPEHVLQAGDWLGCVGESDGLQKLRALASC